MKSLPGVLAAAGTISFMAFLLIISARTFAVDIATIDTNGNSILVSTPVVVIAATPTPPVTICQKIGNTTLCTTY